MLVSKGPILGRKMVSGKWMKQPGRRSFLRDTSGNVAMMWGLMGGVLVGLMGLTVDFTRAQAIRTQMQNAADGAVLVAERSANLTMAQREAAARAFFDSEMGDMAGDATFSLVQLEEGGHQVTAYMPMPVGLAGIINNDDWNLHVQAGAEAEAGKPVEVALVLDNTGSMSNDMQALRDAASDLATDLFSLDGENVSVALVPFVAQVNIGNQDSHLDWIDQTGAAPYNGELLEGRSIAYRSSGGTSNCTTLSTLPFAGYPGPYRLTWRRGTGGTNGQTSRCYAWTPSDGISHLQLFDLIPNTEWKGCVEARPEPYDITDEVPTVTNPETMFVPFFWLDTTDGYNNSYFNDNSGDISGATMSVHMASGSPTSTHARSARMLNPFKYRGNNGAISTSSPSAVGPNRGCPTPIVPLTTNENTIQTNIAAMRHWSGGGTNQAEGLAWGWRVLSPTAPFTEGAAYGDDVNKVLVLMSDGENTNVGSEPVFGTDYSAYNFLGLWRDYASGSLLNQTIAGIMQGILPPTYRRNINSSTAYVNYINAREAQVCNNIKAEGIEIYTVIFRETDATTEALMRNCASSPDNFFRADNAQELAEAFDAIGTGIGELRLTN